MEMELKIKELAYEYKNEQNAFMQVKPKTKKKIRNFQKWILGHHLKKENIITSEQKFFDFCSYCGEALFFRCYEYGLDWEFEIECYCERLKKTAQKQMKQKIAEHKKAAKNVKQLTFW